MSAAAHHAAAAAAAASRQRQQQRRGPAPPPQKPQPPPPKQAEEVVQHEPGAKVGIEERAKKAGVEFVTSGTTPASLLTPDDLVMDDPDFEFRFKLLPYVEPATKELMDDLDETRRVDEENKRRHTLNSDPRAGTSTYAQVRLLMRRLGNQDYKFPMPITYHDRARSLWLKRIQDKNYQTVEAVRFLYEKSGGTRVPIRDFPLEDATRLANDLCIQQFIEEKKSATGGMIDVRHLAPKDHHLVCDCNYKWNGYSKTCAGVNSAAASRLKLSWRVSDTDFTFLNPKFEICLVPEGYDVKK
jgi:hypothetical protein